MHDPRIGRFFAVDPLSKTYPFYSPYSFSGNRVINAVELEGLEPEEIIDKNGKLTKPMIAVLNAAFQYDKIWMQNTTWISSKDPSLTTAQKVHYFIVTRSPGATVYYNSVIYKDAKKFAMPDDWFGLVAHEQSHREDMLKDGYTSFYKKYLADGTKYSYRNIPTEVEAYEIEEKYVPKLLEYSTKIGNVREIFYSSINEDDKSKLLEKIGADFRVNVILQGKIDNNTKEANYYNSEAKKMRTELKRKGKDQNTTTVLLYEAFAKDLLKENKKLRNEQKEIKEKNNL